MYSDYKQQLRCYANCEIMNKRIISINDNNGYHLY